MKVRVTSTYKYNPIGWDVFHPTSNNDLHPGQLVRVINLRGCPPANTMGQCYVVPATNPTGNTPEARRGFVMVSTGSLEKKS